MGRLRQSVEEADEAGVRSAAQMLGLEVDDRGRGRAGAGGSGERADGMADGEAVDPGGGRKTRLQERLVNALEREQVDMVLEGLKQPKGERDLVRRRRLADLGSERTKHGWLTAVNSAHGPVLRPNQFLTCLRIRLGLPVEPFAGIGKCSECGKKYTAEGMGPHALVCAKGQSVKGHNRIRDHLADLAKISDGTTSTEQKVGSAADEDAENLRPADILTSASPLGGVGLAALDIGIKCPFATSAAEGRDIVEDYRMEKIRKYNRVAKDAGWDYRPMTMSCFCRPHPDTVMVVHRLARAAARKFGVEDVSRIEERWWKNCSTLLAERVANMVLRCSPTIPLPTALGGVVDTGEDEGGGTEGRGTREVVDVGSVVEGSELQ